MCEQCENAQPSPTLLTEDQEIQQDQEQPIIFFEPFQIATENLAECEDIQFDKDEFVRGLKDASHACGMYTALLNAGMSVEDAIVLISNMQNIKHNIEMTKIQCDAQVKVSENKSIIVESQQL